MRINRGRAVPFTVLGGFLGAGKTTLLNALLRAPGGRRIAVLVNDFGAVNIDAALIAGAEGETLALANGCLCCAAGEDLSDAMGRVLARDPPPEHVVLEASGVADPARLADIGRIDPDLDLHGAVVVADALRGAAPAEDARIGATFRRQMAAADLLVVSKLDLLPEAETAGAVAALAALAPGAAVAAAPLGADALLARRARRPVPAGPHAMPFATRTLRRGAPLPREALRAALAALPEGVLRAKGLLALEEGPALVQQVGARIEITPWDGACADRLVLIGDAAVEDAAAALAPLGLLPA